MFSKNTYGYSMQDYVSWHFDNEVFCVCLCCTIMYSFYSEKEVFGSDVGYFGNDLMFFASC